LDTVVEEKVKTIQHISAIRSTIIKKFKLFDQYIELRKLDSIFLIFSY